MDADSQLPANVTGRARQASLPAFTGFTLSWLIQIVDIEQELDSTSLFHEKLCFASFSA